MSSDSRHDVYGESDWSLRFSNASQTKPSKIVFTSRSKWPCSNCFRSAFLIMWKTNHSRTSSGMPIASVESIFLIWFPRSRRNSGWQKMGRVSSLNFNNVLRISGLTRLISPSPHSAMHRCCGTNYCTRYYVLYSYLSTNHMQLVHQTSSSMLQVSCSNFVKYVGNVLFCPFLPFWHFFYISLTSCLLHLTGIAFLTADAAAIICGNEAIRLASHSSARREPIQRMWAKKNCKIWPGIIQHELCSTLFFICRLLAKLWK